MHQIRKSFRSINIKLLIAIILASTCITGVATLVNVYIDYLNEKEVQRLTLEQIRSSALNSSIQTAWDLDDFQTFSNLESIFFIHDINSIKIFDAKNNLIFHKEKPVEPHVERFNFTLNYPLEYYHKNEIKKLGVMTVVLTNYFMYRRILKKLCIYFLTQGIKTFLISLVMMSIFNYYVTRHLMAFVSHFSNQSNNENKPLIPFHLKSKDQKFTDEFDMLTSTFNGLVKTVNQRYDHQQSKYEHILNSAAEGIICIEFDYTISYINSSGAGILGWRPEDIIGLDAKSVFLPDNKKLLAKQEALYIADILESTHFPFSQEVYFKRRGNIVFPVECTSATIKDQNNKNCGSVIVFKDITEKLAVQKQLIESKETAENALDTKKRFLANMSHEIRTPLNGIIGFTSLLLESNLNKEDKEHVSTIKECSESLLILVNYILDFSRLEQGKLEVYNQRMDLEKCVKSVAALFKKTVADKNIELSYTFSKNVPSIIYSDYNRIRQVLINIINNAIKFTNFGSVKVAITSSQINSTYHKFKFEITDTGIGIPKNMIPKLFNRFTQIDNSSTRKYGGAGLGLAICKGLVDLLGGEIGVSSEYGKGSTFYFTIVAKIFPNKNQRTYSKNTPHHQPDIQI